MKTRWFYHTRQFYNILIIEDLLSWQKNFKRILRDEPFNVLIAANAQDAIKLLKAYPVDILLLDVNLSGVPYNVDGLRFAEQIWNEFNDLEIIIVSGSQEWDTGLRDYSFCPCFVLEKQSLDHDDLIKKIYEVVGSKRYKTGIK